jgi:purine-nucleoside phosphorylase
MVSFIAARQEDVEVGDAAVPIATMRDENTSSRYADPAFPAVADLKLAATAAKVAEPCVEKLGPRLRMGVAATTPAMLTETPERVEEWKRRGALCADCGASTLYTPTHLASVPSLTLLAVSGNVILGKDRGFYAGQEQESGHGVLGASKRSSRNGSEDA